MSHETSLDIKFPLVYSCNTLFTTLGALDNLADPDILHPGSEPYNIFAMQQSPPFRLLAEMRSSSTLGPVCLDEIFGVPYMAVVKANDQIMFKNLLTDGFSTITCSSFGQPTEVCSPTSPLSFILNTVTRTTPSRKYGFSHRKRRYSSSAESKTNACYLRHIPSPLSTSGS
jgi:hypothetical protein